VSGDAARLTQVIGNLLDNASKYTLKDGRIHLSVARDRHQATIRVHDTGIGIAAEQLGKVFDMFMQADTSLERQQSGLGIGLTLVKTLVEMHGGTVDAHSAGAGQGSEFVVRLPISDASLMFEPTPTPAPRGRASAAPAARRILIVDDNLESAASLAMLLELAGDETKTAHDGLEAVATAASFLPEVVLLDIGLPLLNGYDVARKIRQQPWGKTMVLIALTGWGQREDRRKSHEAGFNAHLVKPMDYDALRKLLADTVMNVQ